MNESQPKIPVCMLTKREIMLGAQNALIDGQEKGNKRMQSDSAHAKIYLLIKF